MVRNMKHTLILITLSVSAFAADFTLAIGNPVAASLPGTENSPTQVRKVKDAAFAVRTESCAEPAKAQITGIAEGLVNGARQSVSLRLIAAADPGVYLVSREWPSQGQWVVNLSGVCCWRKSRSIGSHRPEWLHSRILEVFPALGDPSGNRSVVEGLGRKCQMKLAVLTAFVVSAFTSAFTLMAAQPDALVAHE
jgi:hypothetical protein